MRYKNHLITSGTQTYSKQPCRYVEGVYPARIEQGNGAYVYAQGKWYVDYTCALGANLLGYAHPHVNHAAKRQIDRGILFGMPHALEWTLAERLNKLFPVLESMRFLKSGSEAVSAAIKIARAATNRTIVLSSGYHGWHDWSTPITERNGGTPVELCETIFSVPYGNYQRLKAAFDAWGKDVACVVIDPFVFEQPELNYFKKLVCLAHKHGALVIFDEIVTGMRWQNLSVHQTYGVKPDLLCLGKSIANGFPLSVVGGKRKLMEVLDKDCFVSSTFGGELASIAACIATLDVVQMESVPMQILSSGSQLQDSYNEMAHALNLDTRCIGNPARLKFEFPTNVHKSLFWQECCLRGVLFGGATHTSLAHTTQIVDNTCDVIKHAFIKLKEYWDKPEEALLGKPSVEVSTIAKVRT